MRVAPEVLEFRRVLFRSNRGIVFPRAEQLVTRLPRHAVAQRDHVLTGDADVGHVEELRVRRGLAHRAAQDLHHVRAMELDAIVLALAVGAQRSEERRVGAGGVRECKSRWWPDHTKK